MTYIMEDEINSQSKVIDNLINKYLVNYCCVMDIPLDIKRVVLVASGSSYNASVFGKYFFENIAQVPTCVEYASEAISSNFVNYDKDALYIFVSQSGESVDSLEAMKDVKEAGYKTLSITNNDKSQMHDLADYKFLLEAGEELAIAATKTYSATVVMLWLIALKVAQNRHINISSETREIYSIKQNIEQSMQNLDNIDVAAKELSKSGGFAIYGLGQYYALALESALKIKETSYLHTSAYPAGEFVHGHFALLNEAKAFLTFMAGDTSDYEKKILAKVLKTYPKAKSFVISDKYEDYDCNVLIKFQGSESNITNIVNMIITIQILALKIASRLGRNVDSPIGLIKVVNQKG